MRSNALPHDAGAPRRSLRDPIPELFAVADLLSRAAEAEIAGDRRQAADLLREADMPVLTSWIESLWGKVSDEIHRYRKVPGAPPIVPEAERFRPKNPNADLKRAVIARDGQRCRFCGVPVIRTEVRDRWRRLQPDAIRWGTTNAERHPAFQCFWLQYDHVLPWTRGGRTALENVVVTCAGCNFGRMNWTLEEVGLLDPRERPVDPPRPGLEDWDGLERIMSIPKVPRVA